MRSTLAAVNSLLHDQNRAAEISEENGLMVSICVACRTAIRKLKQQLQPEQHRIRSLQTTFSNHGRKTYDTTKEANENNSSAADANERLTLLHSKQGLATVDATKQTLNRAEMEPEQSPRSKCCTADTPARDVAFMCGQLECRLLVRTRCSCADRSRIGIPLQALPIVPLALANLA